MFYYDEEPCLTLIGYGMWPATPKEPKVAFEIHLIVVAEVLFLECRLSTKQFCNALKWLCPDLSQAYVSSYNQHYQSGYQKCEILISVFACMGLFNLWQMI
jgi:hypothetical protein